MAIYYVMFLIGGACIGLYFLLKNETASYVEHYVESDRYVSSGALVRLAMSGVCSAAFLYFHKQFCDNTTERLVWRGICNRHLPSVWLYFFLKYRSRSLRYLPDPYSTFRLRADQSTEPKQWNCNHCSGSLCPYAGCVVELCDACLSLGSLPDFSRDLPGQRALILRKRLALCCG